MDEHEDIDMSSENDKGNYKIDDDKVFLVIIINIILIILIGNIPPEAIGGYSIGYELLPFNGLINFIGLYLIRK